MKQKILFASALIASAPVTIAQATDWAAIEEQAKGQTVYFNAWGGSQNVNSYISWAAKEIQDKYGVTLKHVKVSDIAETTNRLVAEKAAGKTSGGSVDMVWINGENFKSMKSNDLLHGPFTEQLPNWSNVDMSLPVTEDFTEPTDGLESPWGVGQFVFVHDSQKLNNPPASFDELLSLAKAFPGKVTYPKPPQFHGSSFLKSALLELADDTAPLYSPVNEARFEVITAPLWKYLDQLHPVAWREGKQFPASGPKTLQLLDDGELLLGIAFNPNAAEAGIENGTLAPTTRTIAFEKGALSNVHFLAVPFNANAKEGALVAINFMLSEEAQAKKAKNSVWGDPAVVKIKGSKPLFKSQPEPHPSWQVALEQAWLKRYGS
ncbi:ABC transporter substrate-binding protein [Veronia nyctiphanis]|uniref:ABC transporter substrate-binding protein n=1 Tax=Veronia nyctiphanis TaxID=1278244 RepID=A0A4Q0YTN3_9GAMM|nr:ABC transporter substrate-binding protein [Veronia nyctiphanis]